MNEASRRPTLPNPKPIEEGVRDLIHQLREFLSPFVFPFRTWHSLAFLIIGAVFPISANAAVQVIPWNASNPVVLLKDERENFSGVLGPAPGFRSRWECPLTLNVAQVWLREMIKLQSL